MIMKNDNIDSESSESSDSDNEDISLKDCHI